jgi:hypothetical protein
MEIDITTFFKNAAPMDYSASVAEIGANAGTDTWNAAKDDAPDYLMLDDADKLDAFCAYVKTFGAWSDAEIAAWSDIEVNALFLQMVSGDMREAGLDCAEPDWAQYESDSEAGRCAGNIFNGDDGKVYYYIGS